MRRGHFALKKAHTDFLKERICPTTQEPNQIENAIARAKKEKGKGKEGEEKRLTMPKKAEGYIDLGRESKR